jgi:hypothetical protein
MSPVFFPSPAFAHEGGSMQQLLPCNLAALAIAALFYLWRDVYHRPRKLNDVQLRERVAYMLWVAASRA